MTRSTSTSPEESGETIRGAGAPSRRSIIRATAAVGTAAGLTAVARVGSARADDSSVAATAGSGGGHAKPSIVMAHGAFAESSSWDDVVTILHRHGHHVVSVAVPLRGVAYDSSYFSDVLRTIEGPVVLVGHSYGGAVISSTDRSAGDIRGLVYVSGLAGDAGETSAGLVGKYPGSTLGPTLTFVDLATGGRDLYIDQTRYRQQFCADLSAKRAAKMAVSQRPILESAFAEPFGPDPLWKTIPSRFIWGELDRNIPARMHRFMADRAGAKEAIEVPRSSHVVGISHPQLTASLIERAAGGRTRAR